MKDQFCDECYYQKHLLLQRGDCSFTYLELPGIMLLYSYNNLALKTKIGTGERKRMGNIRICRNCGVVFDLERRKNKDCPLCHHGEHLAFENNK